MKLYLFSVLALLSLVGCSSIQYVTVDHDEGFINQNNKHVTILGNPPMICHYENSPQTWSGYFIYEENGVIVLDDFGKGNIYLYDSPKCELRLDSSEHN
jgi:uncharacterized protein YcfL